MSILIICLISFQIDTLKPQIWHSIFYDTTVPLPWFASSLEWLSLGVGLAELKFVELN